MIHQLTEEQRQKYIEERHGANGGDWNCSGPQGCLNRPIAPKPHHIKKIKKYDH